MPNMYHPYDTRLDHRAIGSAALTATTTLATITERAAQRTAYRTLATLGTTKISANNELYQLVAELSNDDFTTVVVAGVTDFGATEVRQSGAPDSAAGDTAELLWTTEHNGIKYDTARIRLVISGTSPSIVISSHSTILKDL